MVCDRNPGAVPAPVTGSAPDRAGRELGFLTLMVGGQLCCVCVLAVRTVVADFALTPIPLSSAEIAGNFNLRGRIVTAIDLRRQLSMARAPTDHRRVAVVAELAGGSYALLVDQALEVLRLDADEMEPLPPTLAAPWTLFASGIFRLPDRLMVVLDLEHILLGGKAAA